METTKKYFFSENKNLNFVPSQSQCAMKIRMFAKKSRSIGQKLTNLRPFQNLKIFECKNLKKSTNHKNGCHLAIFESSDLRFGMEVPIICVFDGT